MFCVRLVSLGRLVGTTTVVKEVGDEEELGSVLAKSSVMSGSNKSAEEYAVVNSSVE